MKISLHCAALAAVSFVGVASAETLATLDGKFNVDNIFQAYVSDSAVTLGTQFAQSAGSWQNMDVGSFNFTQAGTYYLHVVATDQGPPAMFVGEFTLTDGSATATFVNGTQKLYTNTTDWTAKLNSLDGAATGIADFGAVGGGQVWDGSVKPNYTANSHYIWHTSTAGEATVVFTTVITVVPAPSTMGLATLGLLAAGRRRR